MNDLVNIIVGDAVTFTPEVLVRLFVFMLALETIGLMISSLLKSGGM